MKKNKCTLLIDGNWLLQSRFSVIGKGFEMNASNTAKNKANKDLTDLMAKSIVVILNRFPIIDNIILVTDGGSWRKSIEKPADRQDVIYKGNRSADEKYDWGTIWKSLKILSDNFVKHNITYTCARDVEGDDWIWYWSRKLNTSGINCIIWSSDNDLKQLVQKDNKTGAFTAWYNDRNGAFLSNDFKPQDDVIDFFMQPVYYNPTLESFKKSLKKNIQYIYPSDIILSKIICGDTGDNIKPVISYKKGTRNYNITEKMWQEIAADYNISSINNLIGSEDSTADFICNYKKFKNEPTTNKQNVTENIIYNTKMVWLNESVIPDRIIKVMGESEYYLFDLNYIKNNYKVLCDTPEEIDELFNDVDGLFN